MALFDSLLGLGSSLLGGALGGNELQQAQPQNQFTSGSTQFGSAGTTTSTGEQFGEESVRNLLTSLPLMSGGMNIFGPGGSTTFGPDGLSQSLAPFLQNQQGILSGIAGNQPFGQFTDQINQFARLLESERERSRGGLEEGRLDTLRRRAQPFEDELRQQARSRLFQSGRQGFGRRGTLTGLMASPELAALEEGLARADLARQESATGFARQRRADRMGEVQGILSSLLGAGTQGVSNQLGANQALLSLLGPSLQQAQLGLSGRTPLGIFSQGSDSLRNLLSSGAGTTDTSGTTSGASTTTSNDPTAASLQRAGGIESFFAGLGNELAGGDILGGLFGGTPETGSDFDLFPEGGI